MIQADTDGTKGLHYKFYFHGHILIAESQENSQKPSWENKVSPRTMTENCTLLKVSGAHLS